VLANTGRKVAVVSGTLPHRLEVTFSTVDRGASTPVDEAAAGYLHVLAALRTPAIRATAQARA